MKRIPASSIAELVIALTIIAVCFTIASQVFLQTNRSTIQFQEVREQTEYQSQVLDALIHDTLPDQKEWKGLYGTIELETETKDSVTFSEFSLVNNQKTVWQQAFFSEQ